MLTERRTRQIKDEPERRWFSDDILDLLVWLDDRSVIIGFQLCIDMAGVELALVWKPDVGYSNYRVDSGEDSPEKNLSPLLVEDGEFPVEKVRQAFLERSLEIDPTIRDFVLAKLD